MTSPDPTGLLRWGQAGVYSAWDDRQVITALAGGRTGVIRPVSIAAGPGLSASVDAGWLAVAPNGDNTVSVITSPFAVLVQCAPGGASARTDEIRAEIADPETAQWTMHVYPAGVVTGGLQLATIDVPANATTAAQMTFHPRAQDFSTGGAIPGPQGIQGLTGPAGPSWAGPTAFTPAVLGGGAATFSTATGVYYTAGDLVFFNCTLVSAVAGSGATTLTFNGPPVNLNRADRQVIIGHGESNTNMAGPIQIVSFTGGSPDTQ